MPKISTLNSVYPTDCATLLSIRQQYADRIYFTNRGYICYYLSETLKPFEHRLVADRAFAGIPEGYHVHHINGQRFDNRSMNLELLSPKQHASLHHGSPIVIQCAGCDDVIEVPWNRIIRSNRVHCSRQCRGLAQRKVKHPTKEQLIELLTTLHNWSAIGRMFGVSDNAVRKWAKRYKIDLPICAGRKVQSSPYQV